MKLIKAILNYFFGSDSTSLPRDRQALALGTRLDAKDRASGLEWNGVEPIRRRGKGR